MTPVRLDVGEAVVAGDRVAPASVVVEGERIVGVGTPEEVGEVPGARVVRRPDCLAVPGFVDLQCNGAVGHDFREARPGTWPDAGSYLLSTGVTAVCPTLPSTAGEAYRPALEALAAAVGEADAPRCLGVHLEGPFLHPDRRGAHPLEALRRPDPAWVAEMLEGVPLPVAVWTLAPELPGAFDVIEQLASAGVVVSAGHTEAVYEQVVEAVDRGLSMVTHLFNAQPPMHHREPGIVGAALDLEDLSVGLILDFIHVDEVVAKAALRVLGDRAFAVTDSIAAAGLPPGVHHLGGGQVDTRSGAPRFSDDTIAGSVLRMDEAFRNAVRLAGVAGAVSLTSTAPAQALRRPDLGTLTAGATADVVLLGPGLLVDEVWLAGRRVWPLAAV